MGLEAGDSSEHAEVPKRVLVAAMIVKNENILLVHNIKHGLRIEPPGGKVNPGERPEDAVRREVWEELGIEVKPTRLLGIYQTRSPEGAFLVYTYLCAIVRGEPLPGREPTKIGHFEWVSRQKLLSLSEDPTPDGGGQLVPNLKAALRDLEPYLR